MNRIVQLILCLVLGFQTLRGQHIKFSGEAGLPEPAVQALAADALGRLWVATEGPQTALFDGQGFRVPALLQNPPFQGVNDIAALKGGVVLLGTSEGLYEYDGTHLTVIPLESEPTLQVYRALEDASGRLWVGTERGVYLRQTREWVNFSRQQGWPESPVLALLEDSKGRVWFGGENGLWKLEGKKAEPVRFEKGWKGRAVLSLVEDGAGRLWCATREDGILLWEDGKFQQWTTRQGLLDNALLSLFRDSKQHIWIAYQNGGASRWEASDAKFHPVPGLGQRTVRCFAEDAFGQLWLGTDDGLLLFRPGEFELETHATEALGSEPIFSVMKDARGRLWVGRGKNGAGFVEGGRFHDILEGTPFARAVIRNIFEDSKGNIWLASEDTGLALYTPEGKLVTFTPKEGFPHPNVTGLGEDREGHIWAGTWGSGLVRLSPAPDNPKGYSIERVYRSAKFPDRLIQTLVIDAQNHLWVATRRHGVVLVENGITAAVFDRKQGLPSDNARDLYLTPEGRLWVATDRGVAFLSIQAPTPKPQRLSLRGSGNLFALLQDPAGALWLASTDRLERLEVTADGEVTDRRVFQSSEGFPGVTTSPNTAFLDADGAPWFGTESGLVRVRRRASEAPIAPPTVRLAAWEAIVPGPEPDSVFTLLPFGVQEAGFQVPPGTQRLRLHFETAAPVGSQPVLRWKMEGIQDEWSAALSGAVLELLDLKKGNYELEVQAGDGRQWGATRAVRFEIKGKPLELGLNDKLLSLLGLLVLVLLFYGVYRQMRKNAEEKVQTLEIENYLLSLEKKSLQLHLPASFLKETLSSLSTLARQGNTSRLCEFQEKLAGFLQNLSLQAREELLTLETEIESLTQFLELAQLNHRQSFDYQIGFGNGLQPSQLYIPSRLLLPFLNEILAKGAPPNPGERKSIKLTFTRQRTHLEASLVITGARSLRTRLNGREAAPQALQIAEERLNLYNASFPNLSRSVVYRTSAGTDGHPVVHVDFFIPVLTTPATQTPARKTKAAEKA